MTRQHIKVGSAAWWRRALVEVLPGYLVSLIMLPVIISGGKFWPWTPQTTDLQVYLYAVRAMLHGANIMTWTSPGWHLYFIYPPISAILMLPLAIGPYLLWQFIWTAGVVIAQNSVMIRCHIPRGWALGLLSAALVVGMEPLRTTIGYGQINTFLMAMVFIDLLPANTDRKRRLPGGLLIGIAAAVKLTPALFVLMLLILGRKKQAITAMITFVVLTAIGTALQPGATITYVKSLLGGDTHTSGPLYVGNQSMLGVVLRFFGEDSTTSRLGLVICFLVAVLAAIAGSYWWKQGAHILAIGMVGLGTNLASPLAWTHHFVWILPFGLAVIYQLHRLTGDPRRLIWPGARADHVPLPRWMILGGGLMVFYICTSLPLAVLPYAGDVENTYNAGQRLIANFGPLMALALMVATAVRMLRNSGPAGDRSLASEEEENRP